MMKPPLGSGNTSSGAKPAKNKKMVEFAIVKNQKAKMTALEL